MNDFSSATRAKTELRAVLTQSRWWRRLANADIRSRYRRTTLGPFWITLSTATLAISVGVVYGQFFGQDMRSYLPYFTAGMVVWAFVSSVMGEATTAFVSAGSLIKASDMPIVFHVMRMVHRHFIIFLHNCVIIALIYLVFPWPITPLAPAALVGFALLYVFAAALALIIALVCVRFRDVPPMVQAGTQFLFFVTPIMWYPESLRVGRVLLLLNPLTPFFTVTRDALIGRPSPPQAWIGAVVVTSIMVALAAALYGRYRNRVAYWV